MELKIKANICQSLLYFLLTKAFISHRLTQIFTDKSSVAK